MRKKVILNLITMVIALGLLIYSTDIIHPIPYFIFCGLMGWSWRTFKD